MKPRTGTGVFGRWRIGVLMLVLLTGSQLRAEPLLSLSSLVTPTTILQKDGKTVTFAIHGYIEFKSLAEMFLYVASQRQRWQGKISEEELKELTKGLLREGIESRVISMDDERPLETLVTHTSAELRQAIAQVKEPVPPGYAEAFVAVQQKWQHSVNCWSASPVITARVLSNWYPIEEGISLYGATYDSTEHFWQAVKYHPDVTVAELQELLGQLQERNWAGWLGRLDADPKVYLPNAYAVEFLRHNLTAERLGWFRSELSAHDLQPGEPARQAQQRGKAAFRFSAYQEKVLWGDLADVLHLVYLFSLQDDALRAKLAAGHFDGVYLGTQKMGFISEEFRSEMLEIWKVKYLQMARFREVISRIPTDIRLEHFLNDGDSPDIPIPVYVGYLNQIREMAREKGSH